MKRTFYEANLSIYSVNGTIYGCISSDAEKLLMFLRRYDCEGSTVSMMVRDTPEGKFRPIGGPEKVYKELEGWL